MHDRTRRGGQNNHTVQAAPARGGSDLPHDWQQRGGGDMEEHAVPGVGSGRAGHAAADVEDVLREHARAHHGGRLVGRGAARPGAQGAAPHPRERGPAHGVRARVRQQAGHEQCTDGHRDFGGARIARYHFACVAYSGR